MRNNRRVAAACAVAVAALAGMAVFAAKAFSRPGTTGQLPFATTQAVADARFAQFREARVAVGGRCLRVLVAATEALREEGLREVRDPAPYDGMIFVFPRDTRTEFTMAQTPTPLDITWYAADGSPVDGTRMTPCPNGTDATCPVYESKRRYRYALERTAGSASPGALGACA